MLQDYFWNLLVSIRDANERRHYSTNRVSLKINIVNLSYLLPRIFRRFVPHSVMRFMLLRGIMRPGFETRNPAGAVQRYLDVIASHGFSLKGKTVMLFGYGGRFDIGFGLLKEGAAHIILCDKYASPDEEHNRRLFGVEDKYFFADVGGLRPRPEWMSMIEEDIRDVQIRGNVEAVDFVLSNSVYEHLDDVEGITRALAALTKPDGVNIHFVDLRDHFFKYPFEMLRYSERVWKRWLNPPSNHNRYRLWDYRRAFSACYEEVDIEILFREEETFKNLMPHIKPEFISGNMLEDAATKIQVIAAKPKKFGG